VSDSKDRQSLVRAVSPRSNLSADERATLEAENGIRQYDRVIEYIEEGRQLGDQWRLRQRMLLDLQRIAVEGIEAVPGVYRSTPIEITDAQHVPPDAHLVPTLVEEMCDYVNDKWATASALHLAAYVMWRLNWIHPFIDGNGRTSRAMSYIVLSVKMDYVLPGRTTIPALIAEDKKPYYAALEAADAAARENTTDVSAMETLLGELLGAQFLSVIRDAGMQI
jgi:Fic family protein